MIAACDFKCAANAMLTQTYLFVSRFPFPFKPGFLKSQATTENEDEQLSELPISISPRKTHGLAAMRVFSQPLQDTCEARLAFKSGRWAWEVMDSLKMQDTTGKSEEQVDGKR